MRVELRPRRFARNEDHESPASPPTSRALYVVTEKRSRIISLRFLALFLFKSNRVVDAKAKRRRDQESIADYLKRVSFC